MSPIMERTMTAFRLISLPVHGALELVAGLATMAAPFLFGFGTAGTIVAVAIGALIVGLALATVSDETERGSVPIAAHFAFDRGLTIGLLGVAVVLGLSGDLAAAAFMALAGTALLALSATTRYSAAA
jgi:hypothetical protein